MQDPEVSNNSSEQCEQERDQPRGNILEEALELAAIEIENFLEEEHGDEGIALDVWEELQDDIEDLDCLLEEDLNSVFW